jgi:hypothetical protein
MAGSRPWKLCFSLFSSYQVLTRAQSYGNATYDQLSVVSQFHTRDFDIDTEVIMNDYMEEIITIPYLAALGFFFAILIFEISLCCRWCCDCCRCIKQLDSTRESLNSFTSWAKSIKNSRNRLSYCFFFLIVLNIICCSGFVICRGFFVKGSDKLLDSADVLYDITIELEDSGDDLEYLGETVINATILAIPTCSEADVILNYTDVFLDSVTEYNDIIDPIPGNLDDLRNFSEDGSDNIEGGLWSLVALYMAVCGFNIVSYTLKKRIMMRVSLGVGLFLLYGTLAAWAGGTVMLVRVNDVLVCVMCCMVATDFAIV